MSTIDFPELDIETYISADPIDVVPDNSKGSQKIAILGLGQAGGRIAEAFQDIGYNKTIYVNTTAQDINNIVYKCIIGITGRPGGAGKNMAIAREAFNQCESTITNLMTKVYGKVDHILVCAALGGGTGCGSVVSALELAKKYMRYIGHADADKRVGAVITIPTNGELNPQVLSNTLETAEELSRLADNQEISPLIMVDNEKLKLLYQTKIPIAKYHTTINNLIVQLIDSFNTISNQASEYITFDATDYETILQCGGHMISGVTRVDNWLDKDLVVKAFRDNLMGALLSSDFDLTTATHGGVVVMVDEELINTDVNLQAFIEAGFDSINLLCPKATIHRGLYKCKPTKLSKVRVYTTLAGLKTPTRKYDKLSALLN